MRSRFPARRGFTLIEIVIALLISAVLVLTGRQMLEVLTDESRRVEQAARLATIDANAERVLREIVGRMEIGSTVDRGFGGTPRQVTFTSWCEVPDGWLESCRVSLALDSAETGVTLSLSMRIRGAADAPLTRAIIAKGLEGGALRYLSSASDGGVWFHAWGQGITAPLAIGIILDRDTTIVPIGERG